ncbi:hypothetical protein [Peristeroidobacter soli]|jgi:hypothetical protein|uniref:hypothetical protein n=1 Tax=Peristeroidobacter soli TaxID=2497877 RepID=UPI00101E2235|nr:hypothetical protein [Peristeroidobacter soli]
MEIPPELVEWVASEAQQPTLVVHPSFIPPSAVDDLAFYHPGFGGGLTHALRHVLGRDDNNRYFARADSLSGNWHEKMADVMQRLRLYPTVEKGRAVLIDDQIGNQPTGEMHGWKVVHWKVAKGRDSNLDVVHQDFITWAKAGEENVVSLFSWRPYLTAVIQPANEGAILSKGSR